MTGIADVRDEDMDAARKLKISEAGKTECLAAEAQFHLPYDPPLPLPPELCDTTIRCDTM